ncbi:MAG: 50S ribosomal protein L11 methyltransferase [Prolixibacteraceae bacterium]|jgi:ribosomal protein L11 methyltransferase|nr:50S ribosomal protein L11 methyltransferase [Prolixibacteraceae bacterium]MBT6006759.1 50S ribosomal protein L11 methyltransferase [Prolixibacteraceae bacterium]MBT6766626.1 50S ribosomal protein L11 methyltransferase [Prolixibacteraceae bacterium]MBT6997630.1 50S ribosomal protein L11 methyltransferase [Prolixibacteraceae bacterium]MBT7394937.1 50S ribosomal protein L11 methyltransferase [Prolixibacteraceae bacterium]
MDYYKITINFIPFEKWLSDVLISQLGEIGFESFVETETGFEAFVPVHQFNEESLNLILNTFEQNFKFSIEKEIIKSQNWNEVWEKNYFKPLVISGECVIRAPFHTDFPKAKYEIIIEPNMAFGTGNHETTSMMVETILEENLENKNVLDMGCGTGILGFLASMKGAKKITAIDIDEWSFKGTLENSALNKIDNIEVKMGDASLLGNEKYDVIFANIHKNVLLNDMQTYFNVLQPNGILIMSGFYSEDIPDIKLTANNLGLKDKGIKTKNNWVATTFSKVK